MKKAIILILLITAGSMITSCKKCYECTKNTSFGTTDETVCDYPGEAANRAENLEDEGYFCTAVN